MVHVEQQTDAGESGRYVFVERLRCTKCQSTDLRTTRSVEQGDGTRKKTTVCNRCSWRFFVVIE